MPKNSYDGQPVPNRDLVPPRPIEPGSDEERFARHRCRFLKLPFDLAELNRLRAYSAFRVWHHHAMQEANAANRVDRP